MRVVRLDRGVVVTFVVTAAVVSVCVGTAEAVARTERTKLRSMVLRARDAPPEFTFATARFYNRAELVAQGTWTSSQLKRWGYILGYEVKFDRGVDTDSPAQLSSNAGAYRTRAGASRSLAANADQCQQPQWTELRLARKIGDAAHLCTLTLTLRGHVAEVFFVVWRKGRYKGSVTLTALQDEFTAAHAVALARVQARRMK